MQSPHLPPDQSLRIYKRAQRLVILSVAEDGIRVGTGTEYPTFKDTDYTDGVYIFTENLIATSTIQAPCGLMVATSNLSGPEGTVLDCSGLPGDFGTGGHPSGYPGGPGGNLGVYIQDLDDDAARAFTFLARGGDGGDTFDSKASVGDGGGGGMITSVLQPTYLRVMNFVQGYLARPEFRTGDVPRDRILVAYGDALYYATQEVLIMGLNLSASPDKIREIFVKLSFEVERIELGETTTVNNLHSAAMTAILALSAQITRQLILVAPDKDYTRGGYPGAGVGVIVPPGKMGADGEQIQTFLETSTIDLPNAQLPFAHPEQCAMLLERANLFFYMNSPKLRLRAQFLYQRIIERLGFLSLKPSDPLYQVYETYQKKGIIPSTSLKDLAGIRESANAQLIRLNSGKTDYYGYSARWVPRASYNFYKHVLDEALTDLESFENAYIQYHAALDEQKDLNDKLELAYSKTSRITSSLDKDRGDIWSGLQNLNRGITDMTPVVEKAHKQLMEAYEKEKKKIRNAFGLSILQVINAFTSIAFAPNLESLVKRVGDVVLPGFINVPIISGGTVTKEYLASQINESEATFAKISTELKQKIDGSYELDEAFTKRLIVEKEQMLSQLDNFSNAAFTDLDDEETRKDLREKFDAYINEVTKRNDLIFQYNVNIKLLQQKTDEKLEYEQKKKELENRQVEHADPDLPAITAYVESIYQSSRLRVTKLLEVLLRSLSFRMLRSRDIVAFAFGSENPEPDTVPLSLTSTVLTAARSEIEDIFNNEVEEWGAEPIRFPGNFDRDTGKHYHLNKNEREQLFNNYSVTVKIPPVLRHTTPSGDFKGCCNVRVYRARFKFTGLKTAADVKDGEEVFVHVQLTHNGHETIVNRSNEAVEFEHSPIATIYSYYLHKNGKMSVLDNGNIAESDINHTATSYAPPGPFAEWKVDLDGTEFDKLDFSDVTDAFFDLCGTNYAYI
ncbi:hypothetical protein L210DRAFT_2982969 [Boletus edulis BED1]|uniref:Uncharacterized protein n=1 Tax=Boletus edulis BED1 TaxID=1328754 RepID=A0AAD4G8W5_BOLED|nr:hypothetical protein L210DRAFT_2982969 [Boletus edulis BED1]